MATYNRANFILETLKSIQNQTFSNWECLIIDDGGTDNTLEVIAPILAEDTRFKFSKRPGDYKKGLPGCRNYGLDLAKGNYIIFFDDDDIVHPQNLELCVLELSNREIYFCRYLQEVFFNDFHYNYDYSTTYSYIEIGKNDVEKILKYQIFFNSCCVMWKKQCFTENRFIETLMYAEEWELYSRIISSGYNGISIDKRLFYARKHRYSLTGEFHNRNEIQIKSYVDGILLAIANLKDKQLISHSIIRHFVAISRRYEQYFMYQNIMNILELTNVEKIKWRLFYESLPLRFLLIRLKKNPKKN